MHKSVLSLFQTQFIIKAQRNFRCDVKFPVSSWPCSLLLSFSFLQCSLRMTFYWPKMRPLTVFVHPPLPSCVLGFGSGVCIAAGKVKLRSGSLWKQFSSIIAKSFSRLFPQLLCVFLLPSLLQLLCTDLPEKSPRRQIQWEMPVVFYGISDWNGWWDDCLDCLENCRIRSSVPQKRQEIDC